VTLVDSSRTIEEHLVKRADGLILLLTPPFDRLPRDPGYINGYVPDIREDEVQYTHAALAVIARNLPDHTVVVCITDIFSATRRWKRM
jgi:hypothetical protein